jgi:hypothetical protein
VAVFEFMNKIASIFAVLAIFAIVLAVRATPTIIGGSPLTVNNFATNTAIVSAFQFNPSLQQYSITHSSLQQTTDIKLVFNIAIQNSTNPAVAIGTWYPTTTNAATEVIYAGSLFATNYTFATITTTNSQGVYISYGQ